jgi:hypothetical protein
MAFAQGRAATAESVLERASPFIQVLALAGIPAAGGIALVLAVQIPKFIYGHAVLLLFAAEVGSLIALLVQVLVLRACLALPSAPSGLYRNVLDFVAVSHWHPAVKTALLGLVVLPPAWYLHLDRPLLFMFRTMGRRALASGDVQDSLDRIAVVYQLALTGGVPLLLSLHLLSRSRWKNRAVLWLLVPFLFLGTAVSVVLIVALLH